MWKKILESKIMWYLDCSQSWTSSVSRRKWLNWEKMFYMIAWSIMIYMIVINKLQWIVHLNYEKRHRYFCI